LRPRDKNERLAVLAAPEKYGLVARFHEPNAMSGG
jgi:hypothetical protein